MPPYLRLGSIPRKRHTIHPHATGIQGRRDLLRGSRRARRVFPRLQHRLPFAAADPRGPSRAGGDRARPISAINRPCATIT